MKNIIIIGLAVALFGFSACTKDCPNNQTQTCMETVPNEACQAVFIRWFYDLNSNKCELRSYSGCSEKGFATEAECNECLCH